MTIIGLGMVLVFGFLAFRNFRSGRFFWGGVSSIGMLLGMASLWVDYERATNPAIAQAQSSTSNPWAPDG
jgi:hypothetical protein